MLIHNLTDLQSHATTLSRLNSQLSESQSVSHELSLLSPDSQIYKQVGPCLLKQERSEAEQAVTARLDFIQGDITRVEKLIEGLQQEGEMKKMEVFDLQTRLQQRQGGGQGGGQGDKRGLAEG